MDSGIILKFCQFQKKDLISNNHHLILESVHPSPLSASKGFFGNNHLQLQEMNLKIAHVVQFGKIAGVIVAKSDKLTLMKLLFQLLKGDIEKASDVYSFAADQVTVYARKGKKKGPGS